MTKTPSEIKESSKGSKNKEDKAGMHSAFRIRTPLPRYEHLSDDKKKIQKLEEENKELQSQVNHLIFEADQLKEDRHALR